jgi:hypothetical protein
MGVLASARADETCDVIKVVTPPVDAIENRPPVKAGDVPLAGGNHPWDVAHLRTALNPWSRHEFRASLTNQNRDHYYIS